MTFLKLFGFLVVTICLEGVESFMQMPSKLNSVPSIHSTRRQSSLFASTEEKAVKDVTGAELEVMLTEWDTPLVVDAYATW